MARKLAARGARLVLLARDERELDRARRLLEECTPPMSWLSAATSAAGDVRAAAPRSWNCAAPGCAHQQRRRDSSRAARAHAARGFRDRDGDPFWGPLQLMSS